VMGWVDWGSDGGTGGAAASDGPDGGFCGCGGIGLSAGSCRFSLILIPFIELNPLCPSSL
jgi:hypothetical protein